ncbi:MAG: hypothetical protein ACE5K2_00940, partial [Candidatus Zixiibacteriota bacterium]
MKNRCLFIGFLLFLIIFAFPVVGTQAWAYSSDPLCAIEGDSVICAGDSTEFCCTKISGVDSFLWVGPSEDTISTDKCTGWIKEEGTYMVIKYKNNGADTCDKTLTVNPNPTCSVDPPSA